MNRWILVFAALAALASTADSEKKVVCYYGSWSEYNTCQISQIQPNLCTHLIYSFVGINSDGTIRILDEWLDLSDNSGKNGFGKFNGLRKQSPNTKTMVAIGGWSEGSEKFSAVANNPTIRKKFVKNVVTFLEKYHFDGFDVDWEYPNHRGGKPQDVQNFEILLKELRTEFDKHKRILSIAVGAPEQIASVAYKPQIANIAKAVHFINLMTYDLHGSWEKTTGHHAGLYKHTSGTSANVDAAVNYWLKNGCPSDKLILGVPFYGRSFTLANNNQHGIGAPATGPGTAGPYTKGAGLLGYNEICENIKKGWTVVHDKEQRTPYAYKGNQWVGYDDKTSLGEKTTYIKNKKLGGAMVWSIDTDDYSGKCGEKFPLLKALNDGLRK